MSYFRFIIDGLGGASTVAADMGLPESHIRAMKTRDSIAPVHWPRLIKVARRRHMLLTEEQLLSLYLRRWATAVRRRA